MSKASIQPDSSQYLKQVKINEHLLKIEQVVAKYKTNLKTGLTSGKAEDLLKTHGFNQLTPPKQTPECIKFLKQLTGGFSLLLWVGAILCFVVFAIDYVQDKNAPKDNLYLGVALALVVLITGAFAYYQEAKSSAIMDSFKELIPRKAYVLRDGSIHELNPKYLVLGDIVEITGGNQVPADILIFESFGCKVDNSSLTGESDPQARSSLCTNDNPMESENIAFFSTYCTEGRARGIVIRTGDHTVIGQIAYLTTSLETSETSIALEIKHFITLITMFACSLGLFFFVISMCIGYSWLDAAIFFIGIIVANVPEGLLATVTVSLSLTAKSMATKNCLVKNLQAVETLGSTSIICSDKTGTLTQNKMRVSHIWFNNEIIKIICQLKDMSKDTTFQRISNNVNIHFKDFLRVCILCSKASFKQGQENIPLEKRECTSDASETGLFKFVVSLGINFKEIRAKYPIVSEIPFNSTNKFHLTVHHINYSQMSRHIRKHKYLVCLKGAPERILNFCNLVFLDGSSYIMDEHVKQTISNIFEHLASKGERVLAFAQMYTDDLGSLFEDDNHTKLNLTNLSRFTLLGLASLVDPPRPEVSEAVDKCRQAGVQVFMVTGDHPITAQAIAESVGIILKPKEDIILLDPKTYDSLFKRKHDVCPVSGKALIIPGDTLSKLSRAELDYIIGNAAEIVFARTSPQQKLLIVQSCQRLGHMVAATGDGVNDSPALKAANIGIAMGITGSDVSKQAADMILMDDNFASIVVGIEEGRVIFDNLKKSIAYTMASNFAEIMPFIIYVLLGFPLALGTTTILCIDLGTDILPAISLAYEKAESDIMKQKPRHRDDHLVTRRMFNRAYFQIGMIQASAGFMAYFIVLADNGFYITDLFGLRSAWDNKQDVLLARDGKFWNYKDRKTIEYTAHTAYFAAVVVCQWADLIICKTRRNSIVKQGMSNSVLNASLVIETLVALFISYCPGMPDILKTYPLKWWYWFAAFPFSIFIFLYDEIRRMILRIRPGGFFERVTYF